MTKTGDVPRFQMAKPLFPKQVVYTSSEMATHKDCPTRHNFKYNLGWRAKRQKVSANVGGLVHQALASYYTHGNTWVPDLPKQLYMKIMKGDPDMPHEDARDLAKEVYMICRRHEVYWKDQYDGDDFRAYHLPDGSPAVEFTFLVPVVAPRGNPSSKFMVAGAVDLLTEIDGEIWVVDHKTKARINDSDGARLLIDQQQRLYVWALQLYLGVPVAGTIYNYVKRGLPKPVRINKNQTISKQAQDTSIELWNEAFNRQNEILTNMGKSPMYRSDYADQIAALERKQYFSRVRQAYGPMDMAQIQYEIWHTAKEISRMRSDGFFPKNDRSCDSMFGCPFKAPCFGLPADQYGMEYEIIDGSDMHTELGDLTECFRWSGEPQKLERPEGQEYASSADMLDAVNL